MNVADTVTTGYALADWRALGTLRKVNGRSLFVIDSKEHGSPDSASVLLLVHGFPTASWDWHRQWDALKARYRVIAFDLLGFGYSDKPAGHRYRIHEQADLAEGVLAQLKVSSFSLMAHDYGDTVVQELLARDNQRQRRIRAACLLNGGLFPETHRARLAQRLLAGPMGGVFVKLFGQRALESNLTAVFGPDTPPSREELDAFWTLTQVNQGQRNLHRLMWYMRDRLEHRERWIDALIQTQAQLVLINGSADPVSGVHMVERYRGLVGKGDIIELDGIGHYPQLEAHESVTQHALSFFAQWLD